MSFDRSTGTAAADRDAERRRRALVTAYNERNYQHKLAVSEEHNERERQRKLRNFDHIDDFMTLEDVPDLPVPEELQEFDDRLLAAGPRPLRSPATAGQKKAIKAIGILLLLVVPAWIALAILATWPNFLTVLLMLAVLVAEVWLLVRYLAKGRAARRQSRSGTGV